MPLLTWAISHQLTYGFWWPCYMLYFCDFCFQQSVVRNTKHFREPTWTVLISLMVCLLVFTLGEMDAYIFFSIGSYQQIVTQNFCRNYFVHAKWSHPFCAYCVALSGFYWCILSLMVPFFCSFFTTSRFVICTYCWVSSLVHGLQIPVKGLLCYQSCCNMRCYTSNIF